MTNNKLALYGAIGVGLYFVLRDSAYAVFDRLQYGIPKLRVVEASFEGVTLDVFLPINNHSRVSIPIQGFTGGIFYGQNLIAHVNIMGPVTILAGDTTTLSSRVQVNTLNLSGNILSLLQSGQFGQALRLAGTLRTLNFNVPVNQIIVQL